MVLHIRLRNKLIYFSHWQEIGAFTISVYYPKEGEMNYPDRLGRYWVIAYRHPFGIHYTNQMRQMK